MSDLERLKIVLEATIEKLKGLETSADPSQEPLCRAPGAMFRDTKYMDGRIQGIEDALLMILVMQLEGSE